MVEITDTKQAPCRPFWRQKTAAVGLRKAKSVPVFRLANLGGGENQVVINNTPHARWSDNTNCSICRSKRMHDGEELFRLQRYNKI